MEKIYIGNIWRKCDLHIHTPYSEQTEYGNKDDKNTWNTFITKLEEKYEEGSIIGINDYDSFDGYKKIKEEYKDRLENRLILPVIEFRLNQFVGTNDDLKKINYHIIFSQDVSIEDLLNFLKNLNCYDKTKKTIESLNNLQNDLNLEKLKDKYLFAIGKVEWDKLNCKLEKLDIIKNEKTHFIFSASPQINMAENNQKFLFDKYKALYLHCSDAHKYNSDNNDRCLGNCFTWVRGILDFETLRQICFSYDTRIKLSEYKPIDNLHKLSNINFEFKDNLNNDFCFRENYNINLNPSFNCIIGNRGTGKSTLINLIEKKIINNNIKAENIEKDYIKNIPLNYISLDYQYDIEIYTQNTIVEFAENNSKSTDILIKKFKNSLKKDEKENIIKLTNTIKEKIESYSYHIDYIKQLSKKKIELNQVITKKDSFEKIINSLKSIEYTNLQKDYSNSYKELELYKKDKNNYFTFLEKIKEIINLYNKEENLNHKNMFANNLKEKIYTINNLLFFTEELTDEENEKTIINILNEKSIAFKNFLEKIGIKENDILNIKNTEDEIVKLNNQIQTLNKDIADLDSKIINFSDDLNIIFDNYKREYNNILDIVNNKFANSKTGEENLIKFELEINKDLIEEDYSKLISNYLKEENITEKDTSSFISKFLENTEQINKFDKAGSYVNDLLTRNIKTDTFQKYHSLLINKPEYFEILLFSYNKIFYDPKYIRINIFFKNKNINLCSFGQRCTAILIVLLSLGDNPIIIDEPESHLGQEVISSTIVPIIKRIKYNRQIIFATHNANFVVNGDADLILQLTENKKNITEIKPLSIDEIKNRDKIIQLEGGNEAFKKREKKYNLKN